MSAYRILVVEDDAKLAGFLAEHLTRYGYEVRRVRDFDDVMGEFAAVDPHLVLLDVNLPRYDGFHWCRRIRAASHVPILFLTARAGEMDQVRAIEHGADDYLIKPFHLEVVTAKVKGALRRAYGEYATGTARAGAWAGDGARVGAGGGGTWPGTPVEEPLALADLRWDRGRLLLERGDARRTLSRNEGLLLDALVRAGGRIVAREALLEALWSDHDFVDDNTLTVNVTRLRRKLAELGHDDAIRTVRGRGYALALPVGPS